MSFPVFVEKCRHMSLLRNNLVVILSNHIVLTCFIGRSGIVLPQRYVSSTANDMERHEATTALATIDHIFDISSNQGHFVARAVFRGLQGIWNLERNIESRIATFPDGILLGTAEFLPRYSTNEKYDMEYLYKEEGDFRPNRGGVMHAKRSYVYHYTEKTDKMNVWFAKADGMTSDYFFHQVDFIISKEKSWDQPWRAQSSHLCKFKICLLHWGEMLDIARIISKVECFANTK